MAKKHSSVVVSASSTRDGSPVYRTAAGGWVGALAEAAVFANAEAAGESLSEAQKQESDVCDPYTFVVATDEQGLPEAVSAREKIRAAGPTFRVRRPDPVVTA